MVFFLSKAVTCLVPLQELNQSSADKLEKLAGKWEEIRAPLVARYRDLKDKNKNQSVATALLLEEMKGMRERMKQVADETRAKDDLYKQLVSRWGGVWEHGRGSSGEVCGERGRGSSGEVCGECGRGSSGEVCGECGRGSSGEVCGECGRGSSGEHGVQGDGQYKL